MYDKIYVCYIISYVLNKRYILPKLYIYTLGSRVCKSTQLALISPPPQQ